MKKTVFRGYLLTDYEAEEKWLSEMYAEGWKLRSFPMPYFYTFEKTEPTDVTYRLEFRPGKEDREEYVSMAEDYGWSYMQGPNSWLYFWKETGDDPAENEIFSDDGSRMAMVRKTAMRRFVPVLILSVLIILFYIFCVIPGGDIAECFIVGICAVLLLVMDIHLLTGYRRLKKQFADS